MTSMPVVLWGHIACAIFLSAKGKCNSITMWNTGNNNYLSFDKRRGIYSHPRRKFGQVVKGTIWLESFHKCPTPKHVGGGGKKTRKETKNIIIAIEESEAIYIKQEREPFIIASYFFKIAHMSVVCMYLWGFLALCVCMCGAGANKVGGTELMLRTNEILS